MKAEVLERSNGDLSVRQGRAEMKLTISPSEALVLISNLSAQLLKQEGRNFLPNHLEIIDNPGNDLYHSGTMYLSIDHNATW